MSNKAFQLDQEHIQSVSEAIADMVRDLVADPVAVDAIKAASRAQLAEMVAAAIREREAKIVAFLDALVNDPMRDILKSTAEIFGNTEGTLSGKHVAEILRAMAETMERGP